MTSDAGGSPAASEYIFGYGESVETDRITALEQTFGPGTFSRLTSLGVGSGWKCLDVGAGAGSVSKWLASTVGPKGEVVACDIDTSMLGPVASAGARVVRHDIVASPFAESDFDLVHARYVLEWLPDREQALRHMVAALRPGGLLAIEDLAWSEWIEEEPFVGLKSAILASQGLVSYESDCGLRLAERFENVGLVMVEAHWRAFRSRGGSDAGRWLALSFLRLRDLWVQADIAPEHQVDGWISAFHDPRVAFWTPPSITASGRSPI